jgi:PAS domain S-box-containing protein
MSKILVIDDNRDSLLSFKALLSDLFNGFSIHTATSGPDGIALARAHHPDVILLDILMPGMDGYEVCSILKKDVTLCDSPVVFVTALRENSANKVRALNVGADGFLTKPIDETELAAQIKAMLKIKEANDFLKSEKQRLEKLVVERTNELQEELLLNRQLNERLCESEERFRVFFEKAPLGYQSVDFDARILEVNDMWLEILGYHRDEVIGKWFGGFLAPEHIPAFRERFSAFKAAGRIHVEFEILRKDGSRRWIAFDGRIGYELNGEFKQTHCILLDITERKQAEARLLSENAWSESIINAAPNIIVGLGEGSQIRIFNKFAETLTGFKAEEVLDKPWIELLIPRERRAELYRVWNQIVENCLIEYHYENPIRTKAGEQRLIRWNNTVLTENGRFRMVLSIGEDITERKRAEQDLQASQAELQAVYEHAPIMMCLLGPGRKVLYANLAFTAFTGVPEAELVQGRACGVFGCINAAEHPDGCGFGASCRDCLLRLAIEDTLATGQGHHGVEYRATLERAGVRRNVILLGATARIESNESPRVLVCLEDVTERKQAEEAIKESDRQFRQLVETLPISLSIVTLDGDVLYINPKCKELFEIDHTLGKQDALLLWANPDDRQIWLQEIKSKRAVQNFEMHLKTKTGKEIWALGSGIFFQYQNQTCVLSTHHDISEVKQIQEKLRESEAKYRTLVEGSLQGVVIAKDKPVRLCFANAAMKSICGYGPEELLHMSPQDLAALVHPDDRERFFGNFRRRLSGEPVSSLAEYQLLHKDGGITITMCQSSAIVYMGESATLTMFIDISEKKKADEQFKLLSRAVEASPVSVTVTDRDGNIIYANPFFTSITGFSFEEVRGKNPRILKSGFNKEEVYRDLWSTIRSGKDWTGDLCNRRKSGALYWVRAIISPIVDQEGMITNFVAIKEDITERKKILEDLVAAKEQAEESDRLKSAFLANMSHEIRTPMNGILGFLELLGDPDLTEGEKEKYIGIVNKSGQRLLSTINDIVEISRIEAGDIQVNRQEIRLQKFLSYYYDFFLPQANDKGLHLELLPCQDAPEAIFTDKSKLDSILTNLIKNAIKFTAQGSITFGCEPMGPTDLLLFVKDTGKGIHPDKLALVFERFMQADLSLSRGYEGSGLGLAISKAYVEALGGRIWVESELGKGSCFYVAIPGVRSDAKEADLLPAGDPANRMSPLPKKLRILVAEDDDASYTYLETILKPYHAEITRCTSGSKAVEFCRSHPDIDLILMDNKMPDMDGYEAARRIREFNNTVVIIAQTAYALAGDREKSIEAGCTDYIAKPILKDKLISLITKHLG